MSICCSGFSSACCRAARDLKVIVTSATLALERVSRFFDEAPILTVSGRNYPIEVRYRATPRRRARTRICRPPCSAPIWTSPRRRGHRQRRCAGVPAGRARDSRRRRSCSSESSSGVDVLPLFSRLSWEQQSKIFKRGRAPEDRARDQCRGNLHHGAGHPRGHRLGTRAHQPLQSAQPPAAAAHRAGVARERGTAQGPLRPHRGRAVRAAVFQEDFEARPEFTEPEVLRTNLAALLLRLAADGLGEAEKFPFIDPPESRALTDGYRVLQELEALDAERRITSRGRAMARLPLDPRLARALLESRRFRAESELLALVAGLSVPDVRMSPLTAKDGPAEDERRPAAFDDPRLGFHRAGEAVARLPQGARRPAARAPALVQGTAALAAAPVRMGGCVCAGRRPRGGAAASCLSARPASYAAVHRSLLAGFCTTVGVRGEEGEYLGYARHPLSHLSGLAAAPAQAAWVMAANIVETSPGVRAPRRGGRADVDRGGRSASVEARISSSPIGTRSRERWSRASA